MTLFDQIEKFQTNLDLLADFARRFSFPEGVATLTISVTNACVYLHVGYSESDRLNVLALAGETLGRNDWKKKPDWDKAFYSWTKTIGGVQIYIARAEKIPALKAQAVAPQEFPLQLCDTVEAGV